MDRETLKNFLPRSEIISKLKAKKSSDLVIVGGGIHGAAFARLAALNNFDTILFEQDDYASGTSSRSSKMAHGGLRYLETFDFRQVFEGVKAREELFTAANHIARPSQFFIPVKKEDRFLRCKLMLGLNLYDLFLRNKERRHTWVPNGGVEMARSPLVSDLYRGGYVYTDGIINDTRLVMDTIWAAREEGAHCLNYASVDRVIQLKNRRVLVSWTDRLTGKSYEIESGALVNCAGAWVPEVGDLKTLRGLRSRLRYSQGTHILFNKKWEGPSLLLPLNQKGRYYFVWPHFAGTLVGTTERELSNADREPLPFKDEIEEIYDRIKRDLPNSGLTPETAHYCFAGIRALPVSKAGWRLNTSQISRRHKWYFDRGVLSLIGGKLTTAFWTAYEGLKIVSKLAEIDFPVVSAKKRPLPGAGDLVGSTSRFKQIASQEGVPEELVERAISRLGTRVKYFIGEDGDRSWLTPISNSCLKGELALAFEVEQAENLEDLMLRRLGLEYLPGHGLNAIDEILKVLAHYRPNINIVSEQSKYEAKLNTIASLLRVA